MSTEHQIYELKLNEELHIDRFNSIRRVAGGWIYYNTGMSEDHPWTMTFVPFSDEFMVNKN